MKEIIEKSFRDLVGAWQKARLYGTEHPKFRESVLSAYESVSKVFEARDELIIGIIGDELAFEKEIFFDLSRVVQPALHYLTSRGIERLTFSRGMTAEEFEKFIVFLSIAPEEAPSGPQAYLEESGVTHISAGKLGIDENPKDKNSDKKVDEAVLKVYADSLTRVTSAINSLLAGEKTDLLNVRNSLSGIMEMLSGRHQEFLKLATVKRYDAGTFVHLMNVAILSMYFAAKLGFSKDDVNDIGMAGLFHDIGKLYISRKIITKPGKLTDEEFDKIRSHSSLGAEILFDYRESLGTLPSVVAFEHHLKYDLKGYPRLSIPRKPHLASRLVAICDVYDALSQRRSYKNDYPPNLIYDIMIKDRGSAFDPDMLDSFFRIIGVWPIGTLLKLSDGRVGVVKAENSDDIFHPQLELVTDRADKETLDLRKTIGKIDIERALNPLTDGKQYTGLI